MIKSLLGLALALIMAPAPAATGADKVLIVVSGHGADEGKTRPGFEMDELAQAHAVFVDNGLAIEIASPNGGAVVADKFDADKPYNRRFLKDASAIAKLAHTKALSALKGERFGAVFIVGGKGAMFDLPTSADLKALLARVHQDGGVIGAVCHGPAALANVPLTDGRLLARGRRMTGFSNAEERLFGKRWAASFPVLLEDGLRGAGAQFSAAPMMLSHVVVDGKLVTGQNPYSTTAAAEAVVRAMGRTPVVRESWADDRSIALIGRVLGGEGEEARKRLAADPKAYDVPLIAMWGYYQAKASTEDPIALAKAVEVMELAQPHFAEPRLAAAVAEGKAKLAAKR